MVCNALFIGLLELVALSDFFIFYISSVGIPEPVHYGGSFCAHDPVRLQAKLQREQMARSGCAQSASHEERRKVLREDHRQDQPS